MENRVLGNAVKAAIEGRAVVPVQQRQEAPPPEPEQPDPYAHNGHGNRAARRKESRGSGWGHRSSKVAPSQAKQKKRRKLEAAGRKAARKGKR
jgi:hypothetical protein